VSSSLRFSEQFRRFPPCCSCWNTCLTMQKSSSHRGILSLPHEWSLQPFPTVPKTAFEITTTIIQIEVPRPVLVAHSDPMVLSQDDQSLIFTSLPVGRYPFRACLFHCRGPYKVGRGTTSPFAAAPIETTFGGNNQIHFSRSFP
jgi:hypothetical protein